MLLVGKGQPSCADNLCACCKSNKCETDNDSYCTDGCIDDVRGERCDNNCPTNCVACTLDKEGRWPCTSCSPGNYSGRYKDDSEEPYYDDCRHDCRDECVSCTAYNNCTKCIDGRYGTYCQKYCYNECEGDQCDKMDGNCTCKTGYTHHSCKYTI